MTVVNCHPLTPSPHPPHPLTPPPSPSHSTPLTPSPTPLTPSPTLLTPSPHPLTPSPPHPLPGAGRGQISSYGTPANAECLQAEGTATFPLAPGRRPEPCCTLGRRAELQAAVAAAEDRGQRSERVTVWCRCLGRACDVSYEPQM